MAAVHTVVVVVAGTRLIMFSCAVAVCLHCLCPCTPQLATAFGFCTGTSVPLTHSVFVSWVKKLTGQAGILSSGYDGHSFW